MRRRWGHLLAALLSAVAPPSMVGAGRDQRTGEAPYPTHRRPSGLAGLPAYFEENRGQTDPRVRFLARPRGYRAFFTDTEAVFVLPARTRGDLGPATSMQVGSPQPDVIRMRLEGANPMPPVPAGGPQASVSNYFLGKDPAKWLAGVRHFEGIRSAGLLQGIELRWRGLPGGEIEYDLLLAPNADPRSLVVSLVGIEPLSIDASGDLVGPTRWGLLRHSKPLAWQIVSGRRREVACDFVLLGRDRFGFRVGTYDPSLPLVVDPRVEYATYLGGGSTEIPLGMAVDSTGTTYIGGYTLSTDYPVASAYQGTASGGVNGDAFLTKVNAAGTALVYSTYLGGTNYDVAFGLALDSAGAVYLAGQTTSSDFPTANAIQSSAGGSDDVFVVKVSPSGSQLSYSTYLGGNSNDYGYAVAVDSSGAAYVTGSTASSAFPLASALQGTKGAGFDAFVSKLTPSGGALAYSTFLGGSGTEYGRAIAVDSSGAAYAAGQTSSTNFPILGAFQGANGGTNDAFVSKVSSTGSALVYSSYLGGSGSDDATGIAVDSQGIATVVGSTTSSNFPTQSPLYASFGGGGMDAFATRFAANGASISTSTYLGGSGTDAAGAVALDSGGSTYVVGTTASTNFPVQSAIQASNAGGTGDAFVVKMTTGMSALVYSSYFGGSGDDDARCVAINGRDAFFSGRTTSANFPTQGPYQGSLAGSYDGFVVKLITTPIAPTTAASSLIAVDAIEVTWQDNSADETGFEVQRRIGSGTYSTLLVASAGSTVHDDLGLDSGTKYTYRVRAVNPDGVSGWSNETSTTTPPAIPGVPLAPSGLTAEQTSPTSAGLSWTDESSDENFFQVQKMTGTGSWQVIATPGPNQTTYSDTAVLPDRTYSYRVRAANGIGFSSYSQIESLETPPSLEFELTKGLIKDSAKISKDVLKLFGSWSANGESPDAAFDPMVDGMEVRLDGRDGPLLFSLAPNAEGWTTKKGRNTWKSPRESMTRAKLVVTPAMGTWSLTLTRTSLPLLAGSPFTFALSIGNDAGTQSADWSPNPRKAGFFKLP